MMVLRQMRGDDFERRCQTMFLKGMRVNVLVRGERL